MTAARQTAVDVAETFRRFAHQQAAGVSPLYEHLARAIAEDADLLALAARTRPGQPAPNMLFGAVQYLLDREGRDDELARFYDDTCRDKGALAGAFARFCAQHEDAITGLLANRAVQSAEIRRAALLLCAFAEIQRHTLADLRVIDLGCSAGLTLLWPYCRYRYSDDTGGVTVAFPTSGQVEISCALRGPSRPPLTLDPDRFVDPTGVELAPPDVTDPDTRAWLRALCWPEQTDRRQLLDQACALALRHPPRIVAGDARHLLAELVGSTPVEVAVCLVASWSIYQIYGSPGGRERFVEDLARLTGYRAGPLFEVSLGHFGGSPRMIIACHDQGEQHEIAVADCGIYGQWISWPSASPAASRAAG